MAQNYEWALSALKQGKRVTRQAWKANGWWVQLKRPVNGSDMGMPYTYMNRYGKLTTWSPQSWDEHADDWYEIPVTKLTDEKPKLEPK